MKLELRNCSERYTVEQSLLNLFPGELPVVGTAGPGDESWAVVEWTESEAESGGGTPCGETPGGETPCAVAVTIHWHGKQAARTCGATLTGADYDREGARRRLIGKCFYLAAVAVTGAEPPWGMLSGVRPDKLVVRALSEGLDRAAAARRLEREYFVTGARAELASWTGEAAYRVLQGLEPRDVGVYVGIPFCPTRCAYCSFVSQSVERSFGQVPPYVDALVEELRRGGELVRRHGLRVVCWYMGGGTPTTLTPAQLDRVLTASEAAFGLADCPEITVEAGRPDTITAEKLDVLLARGVDRISVNPQTMNDGVLRAIGRRHTAADTVRAMDLAASKGFRHVNMDLIAGLPGDTPEGFRATLEQCLAWRPDNLTVHTLALKKGSRVLTEGLAVPEGAAVAEMLDYSRERLSAAGYGPYYLYRQKYMSGSFENIGWCLPGAECLYNICMMSELCGILGFGAGASTKLVDYRRGKIQRLFNPKYPGEYLARPPEKDRAREEALAAFYRAETAP